MGLKLWVTPPKVFYAEPFPTVCFRSLPPPHARADDTADVPSVGHLANSVCSTEIQHETLGIPAFDQEPRRDGISSFLSPCHHRKGHRWLTATVKQNIENLCKILVFNASFGSALCGTASSGEECVSMYAVASRWMCSTMSRVVCENAVAAFSTSPGMKHEHSRRGLRSRSIGKKRSRAQEKQPLEKSLQQPLAMPPTRHKTTEDQAREDAAPGQAAPTQLDSNRVPA